MEGRYLIMKIDAEHIERIKKRVVIDPDTQCWLWQGAKSSGYGRMWVNGRLESVHRVTYSYFVGEIPDGLIMDHVKARGCTSRSCCNPEHLDLVTNHENVLRGAAGINNSSKTHCKNGHEFTPANTINRRRSIGGRDCRACHKLWKEQFNQRKSPMRRTA